MAALEEFAWHLEICNSFCVIAVLSVERFMARGHLIIMVLFYEKIAFIIAIADEKLVIYIGNIS